MTQGEADLILDLHKRLLKVEKDVAIHMKTHDIGHYHNINDPFMTDEDEPYADTEALPNAGGLGGDTEPMPSESINNTKEEDSE